MATKTLTLRPVSNSTNSGAGSPTRYPDSTPLEDIYLLVSEEVPDDDGTYYVPESLLSADAVLFYFSAPVDYINLVPEAIRIKIRALSSNSVDRFSLNWKSVYDNFETIEPNHDSQYETYSFVIPSETISTAWDSLLAGNAIITPIWTGSSKSNTPTARVTQFYVEVDYEVEEQSGIYIKRNNSYLQASRAYQKRDGSWIEIEPTECKTLILQLKEE